MKERPIIFGGEMVRALLSGRKTQTRRIVKPQPTNVPVGAYMDAYNKTANWCFWLPDGRLVNSIGPRSNTAMWKNPYGQPGDRLWVREKMYREHGVMFYAANNEAVGPDLQANRWPSFGNKLSPMYMLRWACRIVLEVEAVRVERLASISDSDIMREGKGGQKDFSANRAGYKRLWNSLYVSPACRWSANPWVWVIQFRRVGD